MNCYSLYFFAYAFDVVDVANADVDAAIHGVAAAGVAIVVVNVVSAAEDDADVAAVAALEGIDDGNEDEDVGGDRVINDVIADVFFFFMSIKIYINGCLSKWFSCLCCFSCC